MVAHRILRRNGTPNFCGATLAYRYGRQWWLLQTLGGFAKLARSMPCLLV
jgi:hypothetical protein